MKHSEPNVLENECPPHHMRTVKSGHAMFKPKTSRIVAPSLKSLNLKSSRFIGKSSELPPPTVRCQSRLSAIWQVRQRRQF